MRKVTPRVFLLAATQLNFCGLAAYLASIGDPDWTCHPDLNEHPDILAEFAGRLCYRSWQPWDPTKSQGTNQNVTKVRQGNDNYIKHVLESKHGSIFEHASITFIIQNCSRVFTHELVRHRAGCAYSQESLRYVRLNELNFWFPSDIACDSKLCAVFERVISVIEQAQSEMWDLIGTQESFAIKKRLTSALRRIAPMGLATNIVFTANIRALRHIIEMRTSLAAEEEIRMIMLDVAKLCLHYAPNSFQDMTIRADGVCTFANSKV